MLLKLYCYCFLVLQKPCLLIINKSECDKTKCGEIILAGSQQTLRNGDNLKEKKRSFSFSYFLNHLQKLVGNKISKIYTTWLLVSLFSKERGSEWAHKGSPSSMSPTWLSSMKYLIFVSFILNVPFLLLPT